MPSTPTTVIESCGERLINDATMHSRADYPRYDGFDVRGWPKWVVSCGEVVTAATRFTHPYRD